MCSGSWHCDITRRFLRSPSATMLRTLVAVLKALALGGLLFGAIFAVEWCLTGSFLPQIVPSLDPAPPFGSFPTLAVQVSASLLGFYLASVSIVLGTSYPDVSADVRALILESALVRLYLRLVGMAIGAGLALVLLSITAVSYGYLSVGVYTLFVVLSAWAPTVPKETSTHSNYPNGRFRQERKEAGI